MRSEKKRDDEARRESGNKQDVCVCVCPVETLHMLVNSGLGGAVVASSQDASGAAVCLPRRAETFGGFDSHQMNISKSETPHTLYTHTHSPHTHSLLTHALSSHALSTPSTPSLFRTHTRIQGVLLLQKRSVLFGDVVFCSVR